MEGVRPAEHQHAGGAAAEAALYEGRLSERQSRQVDQAMPGRDVGGDVVEAVHVDAQQWRERVLDGGSERDDDRHLRAHQR